MKSLILAFALVLGLQAVLAGPEQIIKQRAKDARDQNNTQQGVPPAPPKVTSTPAAAPTISTMPPQTPEARVDTGMLSVKTNTPVTAAQIQQFARSLAAAVQGPNKPSDATLQKLSKDLLTTLSEKALSPNLRSRLLQDLMAVLNGPSLTAAQAKNVITDIQGVLQMGGASAAKATVVADDVRAVSAEIRKA